MTILSFWNDFGMTELSLDWGKFLTKANALDFISIILVSFHHSLPYREAGVSSFRLWKHELDTPASLNGRNLIVPGYHYSNIILKSFNIILLSFYHSLPYREAGVSSYRLFKFSFYNHSTSFYCHSVIHCHIGRQGYQVSNSHSTIIQHHSTVILSFIAI